jgi:Ca-activated chloride channel family protein
VRAQVIALAGAHRLVTRYTSFVAVERTPARSVDAPLARAEVPTNLPDGWQYERVFGELPQTGTDSRFALVTGLVLLLLAALVLARRRGSA